MLKAVALTQLSLKLGTDLVEELVEAARVGGLGHATHAMRIHGHGDESFGVLAMCRGCKDEMDTEVAARIAWITGRRRKCFCSEATRRNLVPNSRRCGLGGSAVRGRIATPESKRLGSVRQKNQSS